MKKLHLTVFAVAFAIAAVPTVQGQQDTRGEPYEEYGSSVRLNVGAFASGLLLGNLIVAGTYEQRTDDYVGINVGLGIGQSPGLSLAEVGLGVNYYFQGTALHGWYGNVSTSVLFASDSRSWLIVFPVGASAGHQWITRSGFALRLGGGFGFSRLFGVAPSLILSMGWAF